MILKAHLQGAASYDVGDEIWHVALSDAIQAEAECIVRSRGAAVAYRHQRFQLQRFNPVSIYPHERRQAGGGHPGSADRRHAPGIPQRRRLRLDRRGSL